MSNKEFREKKVNPEWQTFGRRNLRRVLYFEIRSSLFDIRYSRMTVKMLALRHRFGAFPIQPVLPVAADLVLPNRETSSSRAGGGEAGYAPAVQP